MLKEFYFGGRNKRGGQMGFRQMPIYEVPYWRRVKLSPDTMVYRPSLRTLGIRLLWTFVFGLLFVLVGFEYGWPWEPSKYTLRDGRVVSTTPRTIDPERQRELEAIQREADALRKEFEAQLGHPIEVPRREPVRDPRRERMEAALWIGGTALYWLFMAPLMVGSVMAPLSCLWSSVTIRKTLQNELEITKRGMWPTTRRWPLQLFSFIGIEAREVFARVRHGGEIYEGWRWKVQLLSGLHGIADASTVPSDAPEHEHAVEFWIHQEKQHSSMEGALPGPVRAFVEGLVALTGLRVRKPIILEAEHVQRGWFTRKRRYKNVGEPFVQTQTTSKTYTNLDEVPAHLRPQLESLMAKAKMSPDGRAYAESASFTMRDGDGTARTYTSLEDMPPHIRQLFEDARRRQDDV